MSKWGKTNLLEGKVAVVTGGAQGIGGAVVDALIDWGAQVMIADLDQEKVDKKVADCNGKAAGHCQDLTADGAADQLIDATWEKYGQIDIVVNNAGYSWDSTLAKMSDEQYHAMMKIHAEVPFQIMRAAANKMIPVAKAEKEQGVEVVRKFVNVTSGAGSMGLAGASNYAAGKAAVIGITKSAAKEWGRYKFNVNAIGFGGIFTRMGAGQTEKIIVGGKEIPVGVSEQQFKKLGMEVPDAKEIENRIDLSQPMPACPMGRTGTIEEAAASILFLCSPMSDYVHGQLILASGGIPGGMYS